VRPPDQAPPMRVETAAVAVGVDRLASGPQRVAVYLHAGQLLAAHDPCEISTVLGSCGAVCLFDPIRRAGGTNHFLLPTSAGGDASPRFGDHAVAELVARMLALGSNKRDLVAKVFGGASLVRADAGAGTSLGWKNVLAARAALQAAHVPIVAEDVGGSSGRRLVFHTDTGLAWVKRL
jgi:chemotaxis protein CheD